MEQRLSLEKKFRFLLDSSSPSTAKNVSDICCLGFRDELSTPKALALGTILLVFPLQKYRTKLSRSRQKNPKHFSRIWASWALFPGHVALSVSKVQHSCIACMDCHVPRSLSDWDFFGWKIVKCTFLQTNYLSLRKAMNNSEWETDLRTLQSAHKQEKFLWINNWLGIS